MYGLVPLLQYYITVLETFFSGVIYIYKCRTIGSIGSPTPSASPFIKRSAVFEKTNHICYHRSMLANGEAEVNSTLS
jgi:hypothetical protein